MSFFNSTNATSTIIDDVILQNVIGSYKDDFDSIFFCFEAHFLPQNSHDVVLYQVMWLCYVMYFYSWSLVSISPL